MAALDRLRRLACAAAADGPPDAWERAALARLARELGAGEPELADVLERLAPPEPFADPLERGAALQALRAALGEPLDERGEALLRRVVPHLGGAQAEVDALLRPPAPPAVQAPAGGPLLALRAVAAAGRALEALHARGQVHGDLRPETLGEGGLTEPPAGFDPATALRERLRAGAEPDAVAWLAPEVARGGAPSVAGDVYALAALAYRALCGEAPLGQIDLRALSLAARALPVGALVAQALAANPARRPALGALVAALSAAALVLAPEPAPEGAATPAAPAAEQARAEAGEQPGAEPGKAAEGKQISAILVLVLGLGGVFVLVGAIGLAIVLGGTGLLLLLALLTGAAFGGGLLAERHGQPRGGLALLGIGTQLLWADAAFLLNQVRLLDEPWAWAAAATGVASASAWLAAQRRSLALWILAGLGGAIAAACLWASIGPGGRAFVLAAASGALIWSGLRTVAVRQSGLGLGLLHLGCLTLLGVAAQVLDAAHRAEDAGAWAIAAALAAVVSALVARHVRHPGLWAVAALDALIAGLCLWSILSMTQRGVLAALASAGLIGVGEWLLRATAPTPEPARDGGFRPRDQGLVLLGLGALVAWGSAACFLEGAHASGRPGPWAAAGGVISALTWALALRHRAGALALLGALDLAITAAALGEHLTSGSVYGAATYTGLVAAAFAVVAAGAQRAGGSALGLPPAAGAALWAWVSAVCGLVALGKEPDGAFGVAWPLAITALAGGVAHLVPAGAHRALAALVALPLLAVAPTAIAFTCHDSLGHLQLGMGVGLVAVALAFRRRAREDEVVRQVLVIVPALVPLTLAPAVLGLGHCWGEDGAALLADALASKGLVHETRFAWLASVVGSAAVQVGLAFLFAPRAASRVGYRLLEASGLLLFFGVLTLLSLSRLADWFYPGLIGGGGAVVLGLGVWQRRAMLVGCAGAALLLNLWIQYFVKLRDQVPTFGLLLGFGVGLVVFGLIYERRVKRALPALRAWG